ncbi:PAS domain-containing sensor histidine kinase [Coleofasciculus sp. E1-EBD-02]|uniref:PAS domain-containing sensor histidine kinase n=1 Tax=Coleofasciculus sp. E1-EBD-02 TaxID=3068481 RepID=UPI003301EF5E
MTAETFDQQITLSLRRVETLWQQAHESLKLPVQESSETEDVPNQQQHLLLESLTELSHSLQELQFAAGELRQQNDKLVQSQIALEAERQRYRELFEFAPDGYLVTNPDAIIVEANQAAAHSLNFSPERLVGKSFAVFVATQERRDFYYKLSQLQQGESINNWPVQIQPRGDTSFLASLTVVPVQNPSSGQVIGLRWRLQDLTIARYKDAMQSYLHSQFGSILNRTVIGLGLLDHQGNLIEYNPKLQAMVGCPAEELAPTLMRWMNLDKPGMESAMFRQLIAGERHSYQLEKPFHHPDSTIEWGRLTVALVQETPDDSISAICILEDISQQKRLKAEQQEAIRRQQAIQQQQAVKQQASQPEKTSPVPPPPATPDTSVEQLGQLLNTILSNSSDFFLVCDRTGKYVYVNQAAAQAWGLRQKDCIGKTWHDLKLSSEQMKQLDAQRDIVLTTGQSITDEITLTTVEGVKDYEYTMTRLDHLEGDGGAVVITFKDLSEQKQARVAASEAMAKEAEYRALKSHVDRLASVVTKELRHPLNTIFSHAKYLENNPDSDTENNTLYYLQRIQGNAQRINQILNDLLLIKKIEAKQLRLNLTKLDLTQLCQGLITQLQERTPSKPQISFVGSESCYGVGDERLLRRMLTNILISAWRYAPEDSPIKLELVCQDEKVVFRIPDFGSGMPESEQKVLFSAFDTNHQGNEMTGSHLGLMLVKHCVDVQGGAIAVESQAEAGSTVTITLPLPQPRQNNP